MHDPMVVAFTIVRPWPKRSGLPAAPGRDTRWKIRHYHAAHHEDCPARCRTGPFPWWKTRSYSRFWRVAGRDWYWPPLVTIWHREPRGADALTICRRRYRDRHGEWQLSRGWRWHVTHWRIQVPPLQDARRRLLTRCAWCAGRHRKGDPVNVSHQWDRPAGQRWWHGEIGLYHRDCSAVASAARACTCTEPAPEHGDYGRCWRCGKFRAWGRTEEQLARDRSLAAVPAGTRPAGRDL